MKTLAISIWVIIPILFFSFAKTKMQAYILFTCPALFFITSDFYFFISEYKKSTKLKWLYAIVLLLLLVLPVRYSLERLKPFEIKDRNPQWVVNLQKLNHQDFKKGILFNYNRPIEAMFYTNLTAYQQLPNKKVIINLMEQGYSVIIAENDNIPEEIKKLKGVIFKSL